MSNPNTKLTFKPFFMLVRRNIKTGAQEYQGTDSYSGGYPYWSSQISSADRYEAIPKNLAQIIKTIGSDDKWEISLIQVVHTVLTEVRQDHILEAAKEEQRNELRQQIRKLEDKLKAI